MWPFDQISGFLYHGFSKAAPRLIFNDVEFAILIDDAIHAKCQWSDVRQIAAFKRDLGTADEIRLRIDRGDDLAPIEISEDFGDYNAFVQSLESHLPGVHASWWSDVAFPAFATNWTVIYKRDLGRLS